MRRSLLITTVVAAVLTSATARADRADLTKAPPIMDELHYRDARHQVSPLFGFTLADDYRRNLMVGLSYRYYFTDWIGVGLDFMATYVSLETGLAEQIKEQKTEPGKSGTPTTASLQFLAGAGVTLIPLSGKMMLVGDVDFAYDLHFQIGAGVGTTKQHKESGGSIPEVSGFSPMVGIGARMFFSQWIALDIELRDYMLSMVKAAPANVIVPDGTGETFEQNFMAMVGVSFFLPPDVEREL